MRALVVLTASLVASPAFAGGVGVIGTGGMMTEPVYFYDKSNQFAQCRDTQLVANYGTGVEFVLGDRDDKIEGVFRGYWNQVAPEKMPSGTTGSCQVASDNVVSAPRTEARNVGVGTFGVQWGIFGKPDKWQVGLVSSLGTGFLTSDRTEYLLAQGGPFATLRFGHDFEGYVELDADAHFRKEWTFGGSGQLGVRYLFD